jgi:hypothetical protein
MLLNRLISHLFGPVKGCRADGHLLAKSGLLEHCFKWATWPGTNAATLPQHCHFQLFGNAVYSISHIMILPFTAQFGHQPTCKQVKWNTAMSSVHIKVKHRFSQVLALQPFL